MEFEELIDNLKNADIQPSASCWEKIEHNLAAGAGQFSPKSPAKEAATKIAGSAAGKAAAVIAGAVAVAAAVTFTVLELTDNQQNKTTPEPVTEVISTENDNLPDTVAISQKTIDETLTAENNTDDKNFKNIPNIIDNQIVVEASNITPQTTAPTLNGEDYQPEQQHSPIEETIATEQAQAVSTDNIGQKNPEQYSNNEEVTTSAATEPTAATNTFFLEIPNVITPNGDGINDVFVINGLEKCDKHFLIIKNQSGRQVLSTRTYNNDWGGGAPEGTYYYSISYEYEGTPQMRTGVITVVK